MRRSVGAILATVAAGGLSGSVAVAHPLGNDSITHFSVLYLYKDRVEIDFLLDMAETPASLAQQNEIDTNRDGDDSEEEQRSWLDRKAGEFQPYLTLTLDGRPLSVAAMESEPADPTTRPSSAPAPKRIVMKIAGVGGLPTYRLLIRYAAELPKLEPGVRHTLAYADATYPQVRGLKRVILDRPDRSVAIIHEKTCQFWDEGPDPFLYDLYDPANMPEERTASVVFRRTATTEAADDDARPAVASAAPTAPPASQPWDRFTDPRNNPARQEMYARWAGRVGERLRTDLNLAALLVIGAFCFGWGAYHALMPGHAKTIVAAYLISMHGTYLHAMLLAVVVTLTHTALVIVVGLVFLQMPARGAALQLWLGLTCGVLIAAMGGWLLFRAATGRLREHIHAHAHGHDRPRGARGRLHALFTHSHPRAEPPHPHDPHHDHHPPHAHGEHRHPPHEHAHAASPAAHEASRLTVPLILWLGISGGIVPCPAAVWILLIALAQGKPAAGLYAVGVFSIGLALTLMAVGFVALSSRRFANRLMGEAGSKRWLQTVLPALGGAAVLGLGLLFVAHYTCALAFNRTLVPWLG